MTKEEAQIRHNKLSKFIVEKTNELYPNKKVTLFIAVDVEEIGLAYFNNFCSHTMMYMIPAILQQLTNYVFNIFETFASKIEFIPDEQSH